MFRFSFRWKRKKIGSTAVAVVVVVELHPTLWRANSLNYLLALVDWVVQSFEVVLKGISSFCIYYLLRSVFLWSLRNWNIPMISRQLSYMLKWMYRLRGRSYIPYFLYWNARSISFKRVAGRRCIRGRVLFEGAVYSFQPLSTKFFKQT